MVLKMLGTHAGYAHDIRTMAPINLRMRQIIEKTGNPEIALIALFDLTAEEIHASWTIPRLLGYGESMGVKLHVTPWNEDGTITCSLVG